MESLSLGNQQRVQLAAALVHAPAALVLDEPFSGLDPQAVDVIAEVLRDEAKRGVPVVFSSHQLDLVERLCDRIGILRDGRIVAEGTVAELGEKVGTQLLIRTSVPASEWLQTLPMVGDSTTAPGVSVEDSAGSETRLRLHGGFDAQRVLDAVRERGRVDAFSPWRPSLHEIYSDAVTEDPKQEKLTMNALPERPQLQRVNANSAAAVWAVLRRELKARLFTSGYVWSTVVFAAMALLGPLLLPTTPDDIAASIAITSDAAHLTPALEAAGIEPATAVSRAEREALLSDGEIDAFLVANSERTGWVLRGNTSVPPQRIVTVQTLASLDALHTGALDAGASPSDLNSTSGSAMVTAEALNSDGDSKMKVLIALTFGLVIVFVIVLWGATMATDVVQEKTTRVVEILIATIRPWQLLAGKVAALTIIGLIQIIVVIAAAFVGMHFFAGGVDLAILRGPVALTGVVSVLIGVPLLAALTTAMAARVEHQEDLGTATQPVYLLVMAPFAAAVYGGLNAPTGIVMHLLSLAPLTNIFAMSARVAATPVPSWELALSLLVALATLAAVICLAGRIYSGSILRAGSTVTLRDALTRQ